MIQRFCFGVYTQKEVESQRDICIHMITATLFAITQKRKVPQVSVSGRIDKKNVVYPHSSMSVGLKEEVLKRALTWMNLEDVAPSE